MEYYSALKGNELLSHEKTKNSFVYYSEKGLHHKILHSTGGKTMETVKDYWVAGTKESEI
jgi:hypothetical protein